MDAYIFDTARTPRGKGTPKGALAGVRPIELVGDLMRVVCDRNGLADGAGVDDVLLGCVTATREQGANIAKIASLYVGLSADVGGATINRFCASSISAVAMAGLQVAAGGDRLVLAGGVESMSRVPMFSDEGAWFHDPEVAKRTGFVHMGVSADVLATLAGIERAALDAYALRSHRRAAAARDAERFRCLVPVSTAERSLTSDEGIRDGIDEARMASFEPAFAEEGARGADDLACERLPSLETIEHRHTIATSPGLADAAGVLLIGSPSAHALVGRPARARVRAHASVSVDPVLMLSGNVDAVRQAVKRAGIEVADVDRFEVNESFAVVPLHFQRELDVADDKLNVNGGAIAMGHPLGATGAILVATLLDELERCDGRFGVASVCGGAGVAAAIVIERL